METRVDTNRRRDQSDATVGSVHVTVDLTRAEAEAMRDGAFTCTSPDTHKAGRRALEKFRSAVAARHPRPPLI
jgi:hypothetical protein